MSQPDPLLRHASSGLNLPRNFGDFECSFIAFKEPFNPPNENERITLCRDPRRSQGCISPCGNMWLAAVATYFRDPAHKLPGKVISERVVAGEVASGNVPAGTKVVSGTVASRKVNANVTARKVVSGSLVSGSVVEMKLHHFVNEDGWKNLKQAFCSSIQPQAQAGQVMSRLDLLDDLEATIEIRKCILSNLPEDVRSWFYLIVAQNRTRFQLSLTENLMRYRVEREGGNLQIVDDED